MDVTEELLAVAQKHLTKVKKSGVANIMAVCPFHLKADGTQETGPSFAMNITNGLFLCHSCGVKGNLATFFKELGYTHTETNFKYGQLIKEARNAAPPAPDPIRPGIIATSPIPDSLLGLFDEIPSELLVNGFTEETLRHFDVGFDSSHSRITFPLMDIKGQLVGISGRDVTGSGLRYKIYTDEYKVWDLPVRENFNKRTVMWNVHNVYAGLYHSPNPGDIILVEGFKACMWVYQAGLTSVTALLGTYLSWEHQWMLERMGARVFFFLDNNDPGWTGAMDGAERLSKSLDVYIMSYPDRLDDDEHAQPDNLSPAEIIEAKNNAVDYYTFLASAY